MRPGEVWIWFGFGGRDGAFACITTHGCLSDASLLHAMGACWIRVIGRLERGEGHVEWEWSR